MARCRTDPANTSGQQGTDGPVRMTRASLESSSSRGSVLFATVIPVMNTTSIRGSTNSHAESGRSPPRGTLSSTVSSVESPSARIPWEKCPMSATLRPAISDARAAKTSTSRRSTRTPSRRPTASRRSAEFSQLFSAATPRLASAKSHDLTRAATSRSGLPTTGRSSAFSWPPPPSFDAVPTPPAELRTRATRASRASVTVSSAGIRSMRLSYSCHAAFTPSSSHRAFVERRAAQASRHPGFAAARLSKVSTSSQPERSAA